MRLKSDRIITPHGIKSGVIEIKNGKIGKILPFESDCDIDLCGKTLCPGFIELHSHGGGGYAFTESSVDDVIAGCDFHLRHGTTSILPTVSAGSFKTMREAARNIAAARTSGRAKGNIIGSHLEGPYLSAAQCGAQCPRFITPPIPEDYRALVEELGDSIARWTYAPENDPDGSFCRYLTDHGILPSAGHTDATYSDMLTATSAGCRLITHLYSCTSTITRDHGFRILGVLESAYILDSLFVEIIADGKHLPTELIKMIIKIKGADRVAVISDSLSIAGSGQTSGVMSGTKFIVEDGVAKLTDRSAFAGSVATADLLLRVLSEGCGFDLPTAVRMMSEVPARILGLSKGVIAEGYDADVVSLDSSLSVRDVFVAGERIDLE